MAKSKNHSSHHKNRKDHRNGIKKPSNSHYQISQAKLDPRYLKNLRYVRKKQLAENIQRKRCRISFFRNQFRSEEIARLEKEAKQKEVKVAAENAAAEKAKKKKKKGTDGKKSVKRLVKGKRVKSWNKLYY